MRGQPGFFDVDDRLRRLSDLGNQLEAIRVAGGFQRGSAPQMERGACVSMARKAGVRHSIRVMMFKILIIQTSNSIHSDERAKFLINDRLAFIRFLGLRIIGSRPRRADDSDRRKLRKPASSF